MRRFSLFFLFLIMHVSVFSQTDSINYALRKKLFIGSSVGIYASSISLLSIAWYRNYEHSKFHWFNDYPEWLQMDKAGHALTSYCLNNAMYQGFVYSGYSKNKSIMYSFISSNIAMASIEFLDGFSAKWGASASDLGFNLLGNTVSSIQKLNNVNRWIIPKLSFHSSTYRTYYPEALGRNFAESIIKDYNGQTYWLSIPVKRFIPNSPEWICVSLGYGADGLIDGRNNANAKNVEARQIERYRQYYFSLDADLSKIKTKHHFLSKVLKTINIIKVPFPAIELSKTKLKGHFIYF